MNQTLTIDPPNLVPRDPADIIRLGDGDRITIRPVRPEDIELQRAFVRALSSTSRRFRFMTAMPELPESLARQMTAVDQKSHVALIATVVKDGRELMIADARYAADGNGGAEFALAIADSWQRLGLGKSLLARLEERAARSGVTRMSGTALLMNQPMLTLARSCGYRVAVDPDDIEMALLVKDLGHHIDYARAA